MAMLRPMCRLRLLRPLRPSWRPARHCAAHEEERLEELKAKRLSDIESNRI